MTEVAVEGERRNFAPRAALIELRLERNGARRCCRSGNESSCGVRQLSLEKQDISPSLDDPPLAEEGPGPGGRADEPRFFCNLQNSTRTCADATGMLRNRSNSLLFGGTGSAHHRNVAKLMRVYT